MAFNQRVFRKDGWQPHPRAFLRKQKRGWLVAGKDAQNCHCEACEAGRGNLLTSNYIEIDSRSLSSNKAKGSQ